MNQGAGSCFFMLPFLKAGFYPRTVALPLWKAIAPRGIIWGLSLGLLCIIIPEGKSCCQASRYSPLAKTESHAHSQTNHRPRGRRLPGAYTPIRPRGGGRRGASRQEVRDSAKWEGSPNCSDCYTFSRPPHRPLCGLAVVHSFKGTDLKKNNKRRNHRRRRNWKNGGEGTNFWDGTWKGRKGDQDLWTWIEVILGFKNLGGSVG